MCTAVSVDMSQALSIVAGMDICAQTGTWPTHLYGMHFDYPVLSPSDTWNEKAVQEYAGFVSDLSYACDHRKPPNARKHAPSRQKDGKRDSNVQTSEKASGSVRRAPPEKIAGRGTECVKIEFSACINGNLKIQTKIYSVNNENESTLKSE